MNKNRNKNTSRIIIIQMNAYLASRQSQDKSECTHTRIGSKEHGVFGGSYHIDTDDEETFFQVYYKHVFVDGHKEYLTERQRECGPIGIDIDFRYTDAKRAYTPDHLIDFIDILLSELHKVFTIQRDFPIYLFEKTDISVNPQSSIVKDGIHFIVGLNLDMAAKTMLRNRMLKKMDVWSNLQHQLTNDWDSVLDENVFKGSTAWQLYGSRKPGCEAYQLTKVYTCRKENDGKDDYDVHCALGDAFPLESQLYKLSIRNLENETPPIKEAFRHEYEGSKQRKRLRVINEPTASTEITTHAMLNTAVERFLVALDPHEYRLNEAHQYVMCLPAPYYNDYAKWIRVGWALRHTDARLFLTWMKFSSQSDKFNFADISRNREQWDRSWDRKSGDMVTIRSIMFWARTDNEVGYNQVRTKSVDLVVDEVLKEDCTEFDIATILYQYYKDLFVCVDIRSARWFQYTQQRWMETNSGTALRNHITSNKGIYGLFVDKLKQLPLSSYEPEDPRRADALKKVGRITKIMKLLKKGGDKIMHEAGHKFYVKDFLNLLDSKDHLLCFNNGVVDFKERRFRDGHPEDYTYKCTNIGYTPLDQLDPNIVQEVITFMDQLFPDKELCEYMWDHAASVLYGKNTNQTFNIYIGTGRNGKSKFVELMSAILGDYKATIPVSLITKQRVNIGGASPEVAGLVGIRYAVMQESSINDRINEGPMKELTGGDAIQCRALYHEPITFIPQFKLVMPTNNLPNIDSKDEGTWRRIRACEFKSQFKEDPDGSKYQFPVDKTLDRKFESWKVPLMSLLVERVYKTQGDVKDCKMVLMHSERYRKDQDGLSSFVNEFIHLKPDGKIIVGDLSAVFTDHWKMMYGTKVPAGKILVDYIKKLYAGNSSVSFASTTVWRGIELMKDDVETMDEI
jgi:P4 family phage/plasmid primase-like protien